MINIFSKLRDILIVYNWQLIDQCILPALQSLRVFLIGVMLLLMLFYMLQQFGV